MISGAGTETHLVSAPLKSMDLNLFLKQEQP